MFKSSWTKKIIYLNKNTHKGGLQLFNLVFAEFAVPHQTHEYGFHLKVTGKFYLTCKYPEKTNKQTQRTTKLRF